MPSEYQWIDCGDGRQVFRKVDTSRAKRSALPAPMLSLDTMPETQSMLDGKYYTSKSALRATYKASGNPEGITYNEIGNDPGRLKPRAKPKPDKKAIRDSIQKAKARFDRGERADRTPIDP